MSVSVLTLMVAAVYSVESLLPKHQPKCCHIYIYIYIEAYENMAVRIWKLRLYNDRQCPYNVTLSRVRVTMVYVEKQ